MTVQIISARALARLKSRAELGSSKAFFDAAQGQSDFLDFAARFCHELKTIGICGLSETAISETLCDELARCSRLFFDLPQPEKKKLDMRLGGSAWRGYFATGAELTAGKPDLKEGLYFGAEHHATHPLVLAREPMHGVNLWPANSALKSFQGVVLNYMRGAFEVCDKLMLAICLGLGAGPEVFEKMLEPEPTTLFRIFNYPQKAKHQEVPSEWGVAEHTDMGFLTLLLQGGRQTSLEVKSRDQTWLAVPPQTGVFFVNIGDMLEYWSMGELWATPHRVRESLQEDRLSFPFFYDPDWNAKLMRRLPKSQFVLSEQQLRWDKLDLHALENITYGKFVWQKIKHVFPWLAAQILQPDETDLKQPSR